MGNIIFGNSNNQIVEKEIVKYVEKIVEVPVKEVVEKIVEVPIKEIVEVKVDNIETIKKIESLEKKLVTILSLIDQKEIDLKEEISSYKILHSDLVKKVINNKMDIYKHYDNELIYLNKYLESVYKKFNLMIKILAIFNIITVLIAVFK